MNNNSNEKYLDLEFFKSEGLSKDYTMLSEYPIAKLKLKTTAEFMQIGLSISTINKLRKIFESDTTLNHHHHGSPLQNLSPNDTAFSCLQATTAATIAAVTTTTTTTTVRVSNKSDSTISSIMPCKVSDSEVINTSKLKNTDYLQSKEKPPNEELQKSGNSDYPDLMMKFSFKKRKGCNSKKKKKDSTDIMQALEHELDFAYREIDEKMASDSEIDTNPNIVFWKLEDEELKDHFFAGACTECHKIPSSNDLMKTCSQCCLVWYCGKECQKEHWNYHKEFCKATKAVAKDFNYSYIMEGAKEAMLSGMNFAGFFMSMQCNVAKRLNRDLDDLEINILINPKVCEICWEADPAGLKPCKICYGVFYCSKKHANQDYVRHSKLCPGYLLALQCYNVMTTKGLPIPRNIHYKASTVREYKPITGTMKDYIRPAFDAIETFVSEFVSYPLSLLYALERTGLNNGTKKVSRMKELTVLMCDPCNGPHKSMCHNFMWEYMFHLLPKLKKLNLILCELTPQPKCSCPVQYHPCYPLNDTMCIDCKSRNCRFSVQSIDDYHKYKLSKEFKKPDVIYNHIVTNMNIGLKEVLTDLPSADPEVPLVLVDRCKEMIQGSLAILRDNEKLEILLPLQLNPFAGIQPIKLHNRPLIYTNGYIVGLRRQIKGNSK